MRRVGLRILTLFAVATTASAALAQQGIHWQHDIETAKLQAKQTNRLVLVHVWGDGCGPCRALESNVFNQPGVSGAIEQQFVPVKLNANEFPATAQGFGITRIPTDVVITPDGQLIAKMISPATPSAYVGEMSKVASQYRSTSGQAFQVAVSKAPQPKILNPAYADLPVNRSAIPAIPVSTTAAPAAQNVAAMPSPYLPAQAGSTTLAPPAAPAAAPATNPYGQYGPYGAPTANVPQVGTPQTSAPQTVPVNTVPMNQVVGDRYATPPAIAGPPTVQPPMQAANPYMAYSPMNTQAPAGAVPITSNIYAPAMQPPVTPPTTGYDTETPMGSPDLGMPPTNGAGLPVSEEAKREQFAPAQSTSASVKPQLPLGAPPLAFDGYCPVSMRTSWKWVAGDVKYGAIHRGRTFLFAGPQEQQQFLANPDFYSPALVGIDPVLAIDHQQNVPGMREHSLDYDNQFYLFSSEATLQQFQANPERYASGVRQAMGLRIGAQTR